ncbi:hypothetical protein K1719_025994 [Acacia pycnantha]|nr:hypothetical protein K1719_025994 [Acacia pycnantha]
MAESRPSREGAADGASHSVKRSAPTLSYWDKLLSPGCAGFLVKHSEDDDIMQGCKDYFYKMNEKELQDELEVSDEEESTMSGRLEGKPRKLKFTAEEYTSWCLPWMNSLIIKVFGASFPTSVICDRINQMWRLRDALKLIPLSNGYYIVSFPTRRIGNVPFEFYNVESLRMIGYMIGRMIQETWVTMKQGSNAGTSDDAQLKEGGVGDANGDQYPRTSTRADGDTPNVADDDASNESPFRKIRLQ